MAFGSSGGFGGKSSKERKSTDPRVTIAGYTERAGRSHIPRATRESIAKIAGGNVQAGFWDRILSPFTMLEKNIVADPLEAILKGNYKKAGRELLTGVSGVDYGVDVSKAFLGKMSKAEAQKAPSTVLEAAGHGPNFLAGLGLDIALDPLTWLTLGSSMAAKAGSNAAIKGFSILKSGELVDGLADAARARSVIGAPLRELPGRYLTELRSVNPKIAEELTSDASMALLNDADYLQTAKDAVRESIHRSVSKRLYKRGTQALSAGEFEALSGGANKGIGNRAFKKLVEERRGLAAYFGAEKSAKQPLSAGVMALSPEEQALFRTDRAISAGEKAMNELPGIVRPAELERAGHAFRFRPFTEGMTAAMERTMFGGKTLGLTREQIGKAITKGTDPVIRSLQWALGVSSETAFKWKKLLDDFPGLGKIISKVPGEIPEGAKTAGSRTASAATEFFDKFRKGAETTRELRLGALEPELEGLSGAERLGERFASGQGAKQYAKTSYQSRVREHLNQVGAVAEYTNRLTHMGQQGTEKLKQFYGDNLQEGHEILGDLLEADKKGRRLILEGVAAQDPDAAEFLDRFTGLLRRTLDEGHEWRQSVMPTGNAYIENYTAHMMTKQARQYRAQLFDDPDFMSQANSALSLGMTKRRGMRAPLRDINAKANRIAHEAAAAGNEEIADFLAKNGDRFDFFETNPIATAIAHSVASKTAMAQDELFKSTARMSKAMGWENKANQANFLEVRFPWHLRSRDREIAKVRQRLTKFHVRRLAVQRRIENIEAELAHIEARVEYKIPNVDLVARERKLERELASLHAEHESLTYDLAHDVGRGSNVRQKRVAKRQAQVNQEISWLKTQADQPHLTPKQIEQHDKKFTQLHTKQVEAEQALDKAKRDLTRAEKTHAKMGRFEAAKVERHKQDVPVLRKEVKVAQKAAEKAQADLDAFVASIPPEPPVAAPAAAGAPPAAAKATAADLDEQIRQVQGRLRDAQEKVKEAHKAPDKAGLGAAKEARQKARDELDELTKRRREDFTFEGFDRQTEKINDLADNDELENLRQDLADAEAGEDVGVPVQRLREEVARLEAEQGAAAAAPAAKSADPEYRKAYEAGWRYSQKGTKGLEHGDSIGAPDAWYDGYHDMAAGRDKWHSATEAAPPPVAPPAAAAAQLTPEEFEAAGKMAIHRKIPYSEAKKRILARRDVVPRAVQEPTQAEIIAVARKVKGLRDQGYDMVEIRRQLKTAERWVFDHVTKPAGKAEEAVSEVAQVADETAQTLAGEVKRKTVNGQNIVLIDAQNGGDWIDTGESGRWLTFNDDTGEFMAHPNRKDAEAWMDEPEGWSTARPSVEDLKARMDEAEDRLMQAYAADPESPEIAQLNADFELAHGEWSQAKATESGTLPTFERQVGERTPGAEAKRADEVAALEEQLAGPAREVSPEEARLTREAEKARKKAEFAQAKLDRKVANKPTEAAKKELSRAQKAHVKAEEKLAKARERLSSLSLEGDEAARLDEFGQLAEDLKDPAHPFGRPEGAPHINSVNAHKRKRVDVAEWLLAEKSDQLKATRKERRAGMSAYQLQEEAIRGSGEAEVEDVISLVDKLGKVKGYDKYKKFSEARYTELIESGVAPHQAKIDAAMETMERYKASLTKLHEHLIGVETGRAVEREQLSNLMGIAKSKESGVRWGAEADTLAGEADQIAEDALAQLESAEIELDRLRQQHALTEAAYQQGKKQDRLGEIVDEAGTGGPARTALYDQRTAELDAKTAEVEALTKQADDAITKRDAALKIAGEAKKSADEDAVAAAMRAREGDQAVKPRLGTDRQLGGEAIYMPKELAALVDEVHAVAQDPSKFYKFYRRTLGLWKGLATAVFPFFGGFTLRNFMGNVFNAYMAGVRDPRTFKKAWRVQRAIVNSLENLQDIDDAGELLARVGGLLRNSELSNTEQAVAMMALRNGVIGTAGVMGARDLPELAHGAARSVTGITENMKVGKRDTLGRMAFEAMGGNSSKRMGRIAGRASSGTVKAVTQPITFGLGVNSAVEDISKLAVMVDAAEKGADLNSAAMHARIAMVDYDDLTVAEQKFFRNSGLVPFYSWLRKESALVLNWMMTQPETFHKTMQIQSNAWREWDVNSEFVPGYYYEQGFPIPPFILEHLPKGMQQQMRLLAPDLPMFGVGEAFQGLAAGDISQMAGNIGPVFQTPIALLAGKNLFSQSPLDERGREANIALSKLKGLPLGPLSVKGTTSGGATTSAKGEYLWEQILPVLSKVRTAWPTDESDKEKVARRRLSMITGIGTLPFGEQTEKNEAYRRLDRLQQVRNQLEAQGYVLEPTKRKKKRSIAR